MSRFEHEIDVKVPVRTAYDQWTQFESFPRFMNGVKKVVQLDDKTLEWTAEIGMVTRTWRAEITDQTLDHRIAWKSTTGPKNGGAVLFEPLDAQRTRVRVAIDAEPDDAVEKVGDALGILDRTVKGDIERFRDFIEGRELPTGAWRGEIHGDEVVDHDASAEPVGIGARTGGEHEPTPPNDGS
jgi:uncharacterized membrane protein